jgi:hypothetical protein
MSNCNACDQQSQRQINVKECFASLVVNRLSLLLIHALHGGKIRFSKFSWPKGLGSMLNLSFSNTHLLRSLRTLTRSVDDDRTKVRGRKICRLSDFRWRGASWASWPVARQVTDIESRILKPAGQTGHQLICAERWHRSHSEGAADSDRCNAQMPRQMAETCRP